MNLKYPPIKDWNFIRAETIIRDGKQCQRCGIRENLCVHHINHDRKDNDLINLLTVCNKCHYKYHAHKRSCEQEKLMAIDRAKKYERKCKEIELWYEDSRIRRQDNGSLVFSRIERCYHGKPNIYGCTNCDFIGDIISVNEHHMESHPECSPVIAFLEGIDIAWREAQEKALINKGIN